MVKHLFSEMNITEKNILKWAGRNEPEMSVLGELRMVLARWHWQWLEQMSLNDLRETAHDHALNGCGPDDDDMPIMKKSQEQCLAVIMDEILPNVQSMGDVENMEQLIEQPPFRFEPAVYG